MTTMGTLMFPGSSPERPFVDFAGSAVVHMVGGSSALWGAYFIGPRIGRFTKQGVVNPMPGHNITLSALGVMILWFGWYASYWDRMC